MTEQTRAFPAIQEQCVAHPSRQDLSRKHKNYDTSRENAARMKHISRFKSLSWQPMQNFKVTTNSVINKDRDNDNRCQTSALSKQQNSTVSSTSSWDSGYHSLNSENNALDFSDFFDHEFGSDEIWPQQRDSSWGNSCHNTSIMCYEPQQNRKSPLLVTITPSISLSPLGNLGESSILLRQKEISPPEKLGLINTNTHQGQFKHWTKMQYSKQGNSLDPPSHIYDDAKLTSSQRLRGAAYTSNMDGRWRSCTTVHGHMQDARLPDISSPGLLNITQTDSPLDDMKSENHSPLDNLWSNENSDTSDSVEFSPDAYRSALDHFVNWIDGHYMPLLIYLFDERPCFFSTETRHRSHTSGDDSQGSLATHNGSTSNSSPSRNNAGRKRKYNSPDGPAGQENLNDEEASESLVAKRRKKFKLACHFHKRNSGKFSRGRYKTCPLGFDGLNRLKDHQVYVHKPAHYCKRCKLLFKTQDEKDAHDDLEIRCERREDPIFADYLTTDKQRAALAKKKPARMKDEDFWFEMWDNYFPGEERPQSPFQELDPILAAFQNFAELEVNSVIRAYDAHNPEHGLNNQELTEFWQFAIYYVVASFASQRGVFSPPMSMSALMSMSAPSQLQQLQLDSDFAGLTQWDFDATDFTCPSVNLLDL